MNKYTYFYDVHSDVNENNVFEEFMGSGAKQAAIAYAKRNKAEQTWVDKVEYDQISGNYTGSYECVWNYLDDEDTENE